MIHAVFGGSSWSQIAGGPEVCSSTRRPLRLLVGDESYARQRDLPRSRDDGGGVSGRGSSPVAGELQQRGQQRHLRGCRLFMDFTCKSGTTGENNTCQPQEASAADYGTVTHGSRHPGNFATL